MGPVQRATWFIESNMKRTISLADIAASAGVSPHHLARAFGLVTGMTVMSYLRQRRLSQAARELATDNPDILTVALGFGYNSHEAFTRAFQDHFNTTPRAIRRAGCLESIEPSLREPLAMHDNLTIHLDEPRIEHREAFLIAGISKRYNSNSIQGIPAQWQEFVTHIGHLKEQVGFTTYGVCCNADENGSFDYICAVQVKTFKDLPKGFSNLEIDAQKYAVFTHNGHVSGISRTVYTIWNHWLPSAELTHVAAPDFEQYDERFDAATGDGQVEIWIPVKAGDA